MRGHDCLNDFEIPFLFPIQVRNNNFNIFQRTQQSKTLVKLKTIIKCYNDCDFASDNLGSAIRPRKRSPTAQRFEASRIVFTIASVVPTVHLSHLF